MKSDVEIIWKDTCRKVRIEGRELRVVRTVSIKGSPKTLFFAEDEDLVDEAERLTWISRLGRFLSRNIRNMGLGIWGVLINMLPSRAIVRRYLMHCSIVDV